MKRAIVTGASGFIGRELIAALLRKNVEVWAVVRDRSKLDNVLDGKLHIIQAEFAQYGCLGELIGVRDFDVCFHLAWEGTWGEPFRDYKLQLDNAKYACDVLVQVAGLKCRRFILASTIVQLEAQKYMLSDGGKPRFSCIYGAAKTVASMLCRIEASQLGIGWNTAVLSSVYGVGDRSKMIENVLIQSFMSGQVPKLVAGENYYDCTYVEDAVSGMIAIAEQGMMNRTYYVGHRELRTFREIVCEIRDVLAPEMKLKFGEYPDAAPIDYSLIDMDALYRDTGFEPIVSLKEGVLKTSQWLKER